MNHSWPTIAIVGVGLIGGSIGRAILGRRLAGRVIGIGRSRRSLEAAVDAGAATETALDPGAASEADLVVVATGVTIIPRLLEAVDKAVRPGTLLTDAGSTKSSIVAAWESRRPIRRGRFVGAHPLAGSHRRGPEAADGDLFAERTVILTPAEATPRDDLEDAGRFWSALGSTVKIMSPRDHDRVVAATSHAPHLAAAAVAGSTPGADLPYAAGGWRDTTRIAAGDPELWADILLDNAGPLAVAMRRILVASERMLAAIEAGDRRRLVDLLEHAKETRDALGS